MNYICTTKHTFISYLSCCFGQGPNKKQHEERKPYPASQLEGILPLAGKARGPKQEAGSSHWTFSQEACSGEGGEIQSIKPQGSFSNCKSHLSKFLQPFKAKSSTWGQMFKHLSLWKDILALTDLHFYAGSTMLPVTGLTRR